MSKVRVLYDFNAETAEEMSVRANEELNVINSVIILNCPLLILERV